jgi:hypothetical protein
MKYTICDLVERPDLAASFDDELDADTSGTMNQQGYPSPAG